MRINKPLLVVLFVIVAHQVMLAAKGPDLPQGSKLYIENKSQSDEAARFAVLLASRLAKDQGNKRYGRPGFPIVEKQEQAAYVLRVMFVLRENTQTDMIETKRTTHALVNSWLLDANGKELCSEKQHCRGFLMDEPTEVCAKQLSDDIKSAQVNESGKRAGLIGWRIKK
jgi:hypothetical protein